MYCKTPVCKYPSLSLSKNLFQPYTSWLLWIETVDLSLNVTYPASFGKHLVIIGLLPLRSEGTTSDRSTASFLLSFKDTCWLCGKIYAWCFCLLVDSFVILPRMMGAKCPNGHVTRILRNQDLQKVVTKGIENLQKVRLDGTQLPITQLLPNWF